jgi:hypothetical protein
VCEVNRKKIRNSWPIVVRPVYLTSCRHCYADDNHPFGIGRTDKKALENCIEETERAMKWFLNSGLCVKIKKTDL